ncbi:putative Epithelial membrane protein, partial [Naja naja]
GSPEGPGGGICPAPPEHLADCPTHHDAAWPPPALSLRGRGGRGCGAHRAKAALSAGAERPPGKRAASSAAPARRPGLLAVPPARCLFPSSFPPAGLLTRPAQEAADRAATPRAQQPRRSLPGPAAPSGRRPADLRPPIPGAASQGGLCIAQPKVAGAGRSLPGLFGLLGRVPSSRPRSVVRGFLVPSTHPRPGPGMPLLLQRNLGGGSDCRSSSAPGMRRRGGGAVREDPLARPRLSTEDPCRGFSGFSCLQNASGGYPCLECRRLNDCGPRKGRRVWLKRLSRIPIQKTGVVAGTCN